MKFLNNDGPLYVGLMSGTSMDSIDAAVVKVESGRPQLSFSLVHSWPAAIRRSCLALRSEPVDFQSERIAGLHQSLGQLFGNVVIETLHAGGIAASQIAAIGSHGQTIWHAPEATPPRSLQLGSGQLIADLTGITTIADFRRDDLLAGGQGAPLAPLLHEQLFRTDQEDRVVINLGGIANISTLPADPDAPVLGWDSGPANTLLDGWATASLGMQSMDSGGKLAARGKLSSQLLARLLGDPYFSAPPPKSTGPDYFSLDWLRSALPPNIEALDVQATLVALTATSIAESIERHFPQCRRVILAGGGVHNPVLVSALENALGPRSLCSSDICGLDPDWVEAVLIAWLAALRINQTAVDLRTITGAATPVQLGSIFCPGDTVR